MFQRLATFLAVLCFSTGVVFAQAPVTDDTYVVQGGNGGKNYGSAQSLLLMPGGYTLLRFDASRLPTGVTANQITHATAKLFVNAVTTAGTFDLCQITTPWSENTVSYNTLPGYANCSSSAGTITVGNAQKYIELDVTSFVQSWLLDGLVNNYGILLKPSTGSNVSAAFDSKEAQGTSHDADLDASITGPTGPQGQPGTPGQGFKLLYTWVDFIGYAPYDVVTFNGSTYIAKLPSNNAEPDLSPASWTLMAQAGTNGAPGQGFNFRGTWDYYTSYSPYDVVTFNGSNYLCIFGPQQSYQPDQTPGAWTPMAQAGVNGAPGAPGQGFNFRGSWSSITNYNPYDVITFSGSSYVAVTANQGAQPDFFPVLWRTMVLAGAPGPPGQTGALDTVLVSAAADISALTDSGTRTSTCPPDHPNLVSGRCGFYGAGGTLGPAYAKYSGPDFNSPTTAWSCEGANGDTVTHTLYWGALCSK